MNLSSDIQQRAAMIPPSGIFGIVLLHTPQFLHSLPYQLYWLFTPFIISGVLIMIYKMAMQLFPTFFSFIVAGKPSRKEKETVVLPTVSSDPEEAFWELQSRISPAD